MTRWMLLAARLAAPVSIWIRSVRHPVRYLLLACLILAGAIQSLSAASPEPAKLIIRGRGILENRELVKSMGLLHSGDKKPTEFDANFVEDAAVLLQSRMERDGYLNPRLTAVLSLTNGTTVNHVWDRESEPVLVRPLVVKRLEIRIERGVLFYYEQLEFSGLKAIEPEVARRFFVESDFLIRTKSSRVFSPSRLRESIASLRETLVRLGYESASVEVTDLHMDDTSGEVRVSVQIDEGLPARFRSVLSEVYVGTNTVPQRAEVLQPEVPYSAHWMQDFVLELKSRQYALGYPDVAVTVLQLDREAVGTNILADLEVRTDTGPQVRLGGVRYEGLVKTRPRVLEGQTDLEAGQLLDPTRAERGRHRLARLGIFDSVDMSYAPTTGETREVVYELKESKTLDVSVLFGYGSYELLRGGLELEQHNLFGLAHHSRLRAIQSFKSSSGDYRYTVPQVAGTDASLYFDASGLRREEISFVREEWGSSVGSQRFFQSLQSELGLRYNYSLLQATDTDAEIEDSARRARVASGIFDFKHDRRDNPLVPRRGYKVYSNFELASRALGGEVNFQKYELASAGHIPLGGGRFVHLGLTHAAITTIDGDRGDIPFNKRFFPGGENSIRGYQQGEAGPRDDENNQIGAETYLQGNFEFEQVLTRSWSVVVFFDGVGFAEGIKDYPMDDTLYSAGLGIRWRTILGPARLEYGRNINPRHDDPAGTLHFSIGFPF